MVKVGSCGTGPRCLLGRVQGLKLETDSPLLSIILVGQVQSACVVIRPKMVLFVEQLGVPEAANFNILVWVRFRLRFLIQLLYAFDKLDVRSTSGLPIACYHTCGVVCTVMTGNLQLTRVLHKIWSQLELGQIISRHASLLIQAMKP